MNYDITLIACLDKDFGIGKDNNLLIKIKKDLENFKNLTTGKSVVMGRKTWESLDIKPLTNRKNYILTRNQFAHFDGGITITSIEEALEISKSEKLYVIGGQDIYEQFLPYAKNMILTHIHNESFDADKFFPEFIHLGWRVENIEKYTSPFSFSITTYIKK